MTQFRIDFRESNPKLHTLYTWWAYEELMVFEEFKRDMSEFSRVSASIILGAAVEQVTNFIQNEAAWFDAAAHAYTGTEPKFPDGLRDPHDPEHPSNKTVSVGRGTLHFMDKEWPFGAIRVDPSLPPGEYTGHLDIDEHGVMRFKASEEGAFKAKVEKEHLDIRSFQTADGLHPTIEGSGKIAEHILDDLDRLEVEYIIERRTPSGGVGWWCHNSPQGKHRWGLFKEKAHVYSTFDEAQRIINLNWPGQTGLSVVTMED